MRGIIRIQEESHPRNRRDDLLEELRPFGANIWTEDGITREITAGTCKTPHEAAPHRITDRNRDNGDGLGGRHCRAGGCRTVHGNYIDRDTHQLRRGCGEAVGLPFRPPVFKRDGLTLDVAEVV